MASQSYIDNVNLAPAKSSDSPGSTGPLSSFVTGLAPGLSMQRNGRWRFNVNYRMQSLIYAGGYSGTNIFNQFQLNGTGPIITDSLRLTVWSTANQINTGAYGGRYNPGGIYVTSNIPRTGYTTNYSTLVLSPAWTPHFGGYAQGVVGVNYYRTSSGNFNSTANGAANLNGDILSQYVNLYSGKEFHMVGWHVNLYHSDYLSAGETVNPNGVVSQAATPSYLNYNGQVQYRLTEKLQPFIQAGAYQNSFNSNSSGLVGAHNGSYWNAGVIWTPSRRLFVQAGVGPSNEFVSLRATPSNRTEFAFTYRNSDVGGGIGYAGLNGNGGIGNPGASGAYGGGGGGGGGGGSGGGIYKAGLRNACSSSMGGTFGGGGSGGGGVGQLGGFNAGQTVNAAFCHRMRRLQLNANYNEYTTTPQFLLAQQQGFDQSTSASVAANQALGIPYYLPSLSGYEAITMRGGDIGFNYTYTQNRYALSAYQQDRNYEFSGQQTVWGLRGTIFAHLSRRLGATLNYYWQNQDNHFINQAPYSSQLQFLQLVFNYRFGSRLSGYLSYNYNTQSSKDNQAAVYDANTVMASLLFHY